MSEFDWVFASIIFVSAIAALFIALPVLLPKANPYIQSQYDEALSQIALKAQKQDLMLLSDCNFQAHDCSGYYPFGIDSNDMNVFFANPVMQYGSEAISYARLNQPYSAYLNTGGVTNTSLPATGLSYSLSSGLFHAGVPGGIDLNQSPSMLSVKFNGSASQYDVRATYNKPNSFALAESSSFLASAHDPSTSAAVRAFGIIPEFWIDLPSDQNLNISTSQNAWKKGANSGLLSSSAIWWDSNIEDSVTWSYRIPFTLFSNGASRTDETVEADFNFSLAFSLLDAPGQLDTASVRLAEYSGNDCVSHLQPPTECDSMPLRFSYDDIAGTGRLDFRLLGFTDANSSRQFGLYFESTANPTGEKQSVSDPAISYSAPAVPVEITILEPQSMPSPRFLVADSLVLFDPNAIIVGFDTAVKRHWQSSPLPYRIPFVFGSGNYERTDTALSADVNFSKSFEQAGCTDCVLDTASVSFLEVNNLYEAKAISNPTYEFNYGPGTKVARLSWTAGGTLAPKSKRYYMLYFKSI